MPDAASDEILVSHLLISMLRVRNDSIFGKCKVFSRMLKRLIHIVAQAAELGIEKNLVKECPQPNLRSKYHPFLSASRRKGNTALSQALVQRFQARGGGYISTKEELTLSQLGLVKDRKSFGSRTATEFCSRVLLKSTTFMTDFAERRTSSVLNLCFDCAMVSSEHVLSVVLRIEGHQFAAPTQLLPLGASQEQAQEALRSLREWLDGKIPDYTKEAMSVMKNPNFKWKEYRSSTKALLTGLANALQQCMYSGFSLKNCVPPNLLTPATVTSTRFKMTDGEKIALAIEFPGDVYCVFDHKSHERRCDFIMDDMAFHRLTVAADEGTEVGQKHPHRES